MNTVTLTEWIDPHGMEEARRHLDCIRMLDDSHHSRKRIDFLQAYLKAIDIVYEPVAYLQNHQARPLQCTYTRLRAGRLYCCTWRGPQKYDESYPRYVCAQGMPSILRHYLMRKWVHDFDIENCHVTLMYQLGLKIHEKTSTKAGCLLFSFT